MSEKRPRRLNEAELHRVAGPELVAFDRWLRIVGRPPTPDGGRLGHLPLPLARACRAYALAAITGREFLDLTV